MSINTKDIKKGLIEVGRNHKEQTYEEAAYEANVALENIKDEIYKKVALIANRLASAVMYYTLYMDKKKMDRKRGG